MVRRIAVLAVIVGTSLGALGVAPVANAHRHRARWSLARCKSEYERWWYAHPGSHGAHLRTTEQRQLDYVHACPYGDSFLYNTFVKRVAASAPVKASPTVSPAPAAPLPTATSTPLTVANLCSRNPGLGASQTVQYNGFWWAVWLTPSNRAAYLLLSLKGQYWELAFVMNAQNELGWLAACNEANWTTRQALEQARQAPVVQQNQTSTPPPAANGGCLTSTVCSVSDTQQFLDASSGFGSPTGISQDPSGEVGGQTGDG